MSAPKKMINWWWSWWLPKDTEDWAGCFCLPKDCSEDLAACFWLPKGCMRRAWPTWLHATTCSRTECRGLDRLLLPAQGLRGELPKRLHGGLDHLLMPGHGLRGVPGWLLLPAKGLHGGPCCLLLLAQGLHGGLGCLIRPVYEFCGGLGCLLLPAELQEGHGSWHELQFGGAGPPLQGHGEGAFLQLYGGAGPPLQGREGEAVLQQDGSADPPLQGRGRRSFTTTRWWWCCLTPAWTGRSKQGISCWLPRRRSAVGQGVAPPKKRRPPKSGSWQGSCSPAGRGAGERQPAGEQQGYFELVLYRLLSTLEVPFEVNKKI